MRPKKDNSFQLVSGASIFALLLLHGIARADAVPEADALQADGVTIGKITLVKDNIFDLDDPEENKWLYRWANRLHIVTRDSVIRNALLFESGDDFSVRAVDESERLLRQNRFLYDVDITPVAVRDGVVDLQVKTKDVWSLIPDISASRSGGANRTGFGIEETNLFGRGQLLRLKRVDNVDRTSVRLDFEDRQLGSSRAGLFMRLADNDDGHANSLSLIRPFYSLDARWTAGTIISDEQRRTALYQLGDEAAEFQHEREYLSLFAGWSRGLRNGWALRWTAGAVYDDNTYSDAPEPVLPALIPADRKLVYPFVGFELIENRYATTNNTNQIGRTEDYLMGQRLTATLGWADTALGSDRNALIVNASASRGFGSLKRTSLFLSAQASSRFEDGHARNTLATVEAKYYRRQSEKSLFFLSVSATAGHALDLDNPVQLGGKSGLRGYPLRYQSGESKALFSIEQRYFTDWYPFRLFRVGGAVFADIGRSWGDNPLAEQNYGWLKNVGFGLRFSPTRFNASKTAHLDFAFPLDGDDSIDSVQVLLQAKRSF